MRNLKFLWFLLAWTLLFQEGTATAMYCNENAPLSTEYIIPFYEETRPVKGCVSSERHKDNGFKIVVVRTNTTSSDVLLTLTDISAKGVVIILDSPVPIRWRLSFFGNSDENNHERIVVMTPGSKLAETNANVKILDQQYKEIKVNPQMSDEKFGTIIKEYYGGLSILAQVIGANRVSLSLSEKKKAVKVPSNCNVSSLVSLSDSVLAFFVHKQKMFGCYHPNIAGMMANDVHVIDLMAAAPSPSLPLNNVEEDQRYSRATIVNQLPAVFLSMTPKLAKSGNVLDNNPRNITLILKSFHPVKWFLESWKMKGHLKVISTNGPVENYSLSSGQHLSIERKPFSGDLQQLWRTIISETGSTPISYVKVEVANVVSMVIPPRHQSRLSSTGQRFTTTQEEFMSNFVPDPVSLDDAPVADTSYAIPVIPDKSMEKTRRINAKIPRLEQDLEVLIGKKCDQTESLITLPIEAVNKFNVTSMTLNEAVCMATKNGTHWILKTKSTSCGSLNSFNGNNPIMMNGIHLQFSPGSEFYGYQVRVPFTCKFAPGLFGLPLADNDDFEDEDYSSDIDEYSANEEEMYTMKILRKRKRPLHSQVLVSLPDDHATVYVGDHLKVETEFKTRLPASLMIEKCWIADHPDAVDRSLGNDKFLIYEGCPANKNVSMFPVPLGTNPGFTFSVTDEHRRMGQIYVFCIMGLCTPVKSLTSGNLIECVDPITKCASDNDEWHIGPAAQQLSRRGPLYVTDQRLKVNYDSPIMPVKAHKKDEDPLESPSLHSSHVVMVGVPAEIAVAISLASFLIGAALTGLLCRIHQKRTMNNKTTRSRIDDGHEGSELQSMIASPPTNNGLTHQSSTKLTVVNA